MKSILSIEGEAFEYASEDSERVKQAIDFIFPVEKKLKKERIESYYKVPFYKITIRVDRQQEIKKLLRYWNEKLSKASKESIRKTIRERVDEKGVLFIRFDKQAAFEKQLKTAYSGDTVRVLVKITSYPFSLDKIMQTAGGLFEKVL